MLQWPIPKKRKDFKQLSPVLHASSQDNYCKKAHCEKAHQFRKCIFCPLCFIEDSSLYNYYEKFFSGIAQNCWTVISWSYCITASTFLYCFHIFVLFPSFSFLRAFMECLLNWMINNYCANDKCSGVKFNLSPSTCRCVHDLISSLATCLSNASRHVQNLSTFTSFHSVPSLKGFHVPLEPNSSAEFLPSLRGHDENNGNFPRTN